MVTFDSEVLNQAADPKSSRGDEGLEVAATQLHGAMENDLFRGIGKTTCDDSVRRAQEIRDGEEFPRCWCVCWVRWARRTCRS